MYPNPHSSYCITFRKDLLSITVNPDSKSSLSLLKYILLLILVFLPASIFLNFPPLGGSNRLLRVCKFDERTGKYDGCLWRWDPALSQPPITAPTPITTKTGSPTPTPQTGKIATGSEVFSLRDLRFKIPAGWWITTGTNPYFGDSWIYINPIPPKYSGESIFIFKAVSNKYQPTIDYQHYLSIIQRETVYVSRIKGELLIGYATPPTGPDITCPECYLGKYKTGEKVAITFISKGNNYYTLEGSVGNYEQAYQRILSTLSFP